MRDFKTLRVWQAAHQLTLDVYSATTHFPKAETYGLTSQLRRSCASVPANIAEGCGRKSDAELARFCYIAMGSASETEYHLLLARDVGYLAAESYVPLERQLLSVKRMLNAFIQRLNADAR